MTWFDKVRIYLIYTTAVTLIILAVAFSVLRAVLPHATGYVGDLEQALSQQIGLPVTISSMDADMYWLVPRLKLVDVVIYTKGKERELLRVDEAFFALAFVDSILQGSPTVGDISLVGADLHIERLADNRWRIQGIEFGGNLTDKSSSDSASRLISAIKSTSFSLLDSDVHWQDYSLQSGQLDFIGANIFIEEFFGDHSLEINLQLPQIYGKSLRLIVKTDDDIEYLSAADLDVYLQADSIDLKQWTSVLDRADLPLLKGVYSGEVWLTLKADELTQITLDASVQKLGVARKDHDGFSLDYLAGKFDWNKENHGWSFTSRDISLMKQAAVWPEKVSIAAVQDAAGLSFATTFFRAQDVINIARFFLDKEQQHSIESYRLDSLAGDFYNLSIFMPPDDIQNIKISTVVENLEFHLPNSEILFRGIDGLLQYADNHAKFELLSEAVEMDFGKLFRQSLRIDVAEGIIDYVRSKDGGWNISTEDIHVLNADVEINTRFELITDKEGALFADLQSDFRNLIGAEIYKYYPVTIMSAQLVDWLNVAITDGFVESGSFVLRGELNRFPYRKNDGLMQAVFDVDYVTLKFLKGWPDINDFSSHIRFHNSSLAINNASGKTYRAKMIKTSLQIPDLAAPRLFIESHVNAPAIDLQQYVFDSGLNNIMGSAMKQFQASGKTELELMLEVPLEGHDKVLFKGFLQLDDNELYYPAMDYVLTNVSGRVFFEGDQLKAKGVNAKFENAPISIDVQSIGATATTGSGTPANVGNHDKSAGVDAALSETVLYINGRLPIDGLLKKFEWIPPAWAVGSSDWDVAVHFPKVHGDYFARVEMNSNLEGTAITLSDAISKQMSAKFPIDFELKALDNALQVDIKSGNTFSFFATRNDENVWDFVVDSSLIRGSGKSAEDLNKDSTSFLDLEYVDLLSLFKTTKKEGSAVSLSPKFFPSLSFKTKVLLWDDWKFTDVKLETSWHSHGMLINSIDFLGPSLQVNARGSWLTSWKNKHESNFKIFVKSDDFGNTMSELNLSKNIKRGDYTATIDWQWFDEPYRFSWQTVQGNSHFTMKDGGVKALDPGAGGRFVGLFNIFKLFDRLTLDFKDVSGEGFAFESVEGDFEFRDGYALTKNIEVNAAAADMKLTGKIGMVDKNYDMRMQVEPNTSAAAFTTGTLAGGAILGAGLVLINKLLGLEKSAFDEYKITGSWDDPHIDKVGKLSSEKVKSD